MPSRSFARVAIPPRASGREAFAGVGWGAGRTAAAGRAAVVPAARRSSSSSAAPPAESGTPPPSRLNLGGFVGGGFSVEDFPPERIRNFSIVAHIDHGKSTLADRLLEMTGALPEGNAQYLDRLPVERRRGITVKAQSASLVAEVEGVPYLFNFVDTPGHVDFSYEVSRALAACQGAVLLVDAAQGVQAQTVACFYAAWEADLEIVPVLNKIDMPGAEPERVAKELEEAFELPAEDALAVSAKTGQNVNKLLPLLVKRLPPPSGKVDAPARVLLFDAQHDPFRGVVCHVCVVDGSVREGEALVSAATGERLEISELGVLVPEPHRTGELRTGQVGYALAGIKDVRAARVGDTWHPPPRGSVEPLPGFRPAASAVFAGIYPLSGDAFTALDAAISRLALNDASVSVRRETSAALGTGFRVGFLGLLHLDVFTQRLEEEHGASVLVTPPTVPCSIEVLGPKRERRNERRPKAAVGAIGDDLVPESLCPDPDANVIEVQNPAQFPTDVRVLRVWEPTVRATIVVPSEYVGSVIQLCASRRGEQLDHATLGSSGRDVLTYRLPLAELGGDFYDSLKSGTSGYASFDYEAAAPRAADLVRLDMMLNGEPIDALARIVHRDSAQTLGRKLCAKLKEGLDRQQFDIAIQAAVGGRVVARETVKAYRKNVLAKCYGGDITRKRKLLEKQKEGKKRMRRLGSVDVPSEVFHSLMRVS